MVKVDEKKNNKISRLCSAYCFVQHFRVHLHSASTHHSSPLKRVGADTISVLSFCRGFPFPTPARPSPRRRANTQTNSRGVFHGTIPASAGLWPNSGLTTVSSLGQPILAGLLPKNGRRNPFLRGPAALQTPYAPSAHRRACIRLFTQRSLVLLPRPRVSGSDNSRRKKTLCWFSVPKSKHLQRLIAFCKWSRATTITLGI